MRRSILLVLVCLAAGRIAPASAEMRFEITPGYDLELTSAARLRYVHDVVYPPFPPLAPIDTDSTQIKSLFDLGALDCSAGVTGSMDLCVNQDCTRIQSMSVIASAHAGFTGQEILISEHSKREESLLKPCSPDTNYLHSSALVSGVLSIVADGTSGRTLLTFEGSGTGTGCYVALSDPFDRWVYLSSDGAPVSAEVWPGLTGEVFLFADHECLGEETTTARLTLTPIPTAVGSIAPPKRIAQIAPNPSRGEVRIMLSGSLSAGARARILDVAGREVTPIAAQVSGQEGGTSYLKWDGLGRDGKRVEPGLYFARIETAGRTETAPFIVIR